MEKKLKAVDFIEFFNGDYKRLDNCAYKESALLSIERPQLRVAVRLGSNRSCRSPHIV